MALQEHALVAELRDLVEENIKPDRFARFGNRGRRVIPG